MKEIYQNSSEVALEIPKELSRYPHSVDENGDIIIYLEPRLINNY